MSEIFTYICISKFFHWKFTRIRKYNKLLIIVIYSLLKKKNSMNIKIIFIFLSFYLIRFISTLNSLTEEKKLKEKKCDVENQKSFSYFAQTWIAFYWLLRLWFFPRNNENSKLFSLYLKEENKFYYIYYIIWRIIMNSMIICDIITELNNYRYDILCYIHTSYYIYI